MVEVTKRYNEQHREVVVIQISKENDLFFNFTYQVDSQEFDKYVLTRRKLIVLTGSLPFSGFNKDNSCLYRSSCFPRC